MTYEVVGGRIQTPEGCEINLIHHCNLSCRGCFHLSPLFKKHFASPAAIFRDLSILAGVYQPQFIKLLGGEPLLHPEVVEVIRKIRLTGICDRIQICTNGILLSRMSDLFWQEADEVLVSIYPQCGLSESDLELFKRKSGEFDVKLEYHKFDFFREPYSEIGTSDRALVKRIYSTCKMAHIWRCHTVVDGTFFKCPPAVFLSEITPQEDSRPQQDGLKITDSTDFRDQLLQYLNDPEPLAACQRCLGTTGKLFPHQQIRRSVWQAPQRLTTEELVDWEFLSILEADPDADDSCSTLIFEN